MKESLAANAYTLVLGWWSVHGFFWTLEALFKNALGGERPKENNAALLQTVSYQLYRIGRLGEAYKALAAAQKFQMDSNTEKILEQLKQQVQPDEQKFFWERFRNFELHPFYYHAPTGVMCMLLLFLGFHALNANSTDTATPSPAYTTPPRQYSDSQPAYDGGHQWFLLTNEPPPRQYPESQSAQLSSNPNITPRVTPVFSEPEKPLPEKGGLLYSESFANFTGTTAPFKLTTPADGNYVMKIEDWNTKEFVATYFIPRSSTLQIELPLGSYKLKFAQGEKWYGMKYLFGPGTAYSYIPDRMDFYISGDYARGHEIELIPQVNGNLETPPMKAEDW